MKDRFHYDQDFTISFRDNIDLAKLIWEEGRKVYGTAAQIYTGHVGPEMVMTFDELEEALLWAEMGVEP